MYARMAWTKLPTAPGVFLGLTLHQIALTVCPTLTRHSVVLVALQDGRVKTVINVLRSLMLKVAVASVRIIGRILDVTSVLTSSLSKAIVPSVPITGLAKTAMFVHLSLSKKTTAACAKETGRVTIATRVL